MSGPMNDHFGPPASPAPPVDDRPAPADAPVTGHPTIDASLHALAQATDTAPVEQLPAYQAVHRTLRETLASIDDSEGGASQPQR
jgi:hypothetical protein